MSEKVISKDPYMSFLLDHSLFLPEFLLFTKWIAIEISTRSIPSSMSKFHQVYSKQHHPRVKVKTTLGSNTIAVVDLTSR